MTPRRLSNALAIVLCIVLIAFINASTRDTERYRWYEGRMGQQVATPLGDFIVEDSILARTVVMESTSLTSDDHVFLVVKWRVKVNGKRLMLAYGDVTVATPDGHHIRQREDFAPANLPNAEPGFTTWGAAVFEIPEDQAEGATLEVRGSMGLFTSYSTGLRISGIVTDETRRVEGVELTRGSVEAIR